MRRDPIGFMEGVAAGGDLSHVRLGPVDVYLASHPDLVREVLVERHRSFHKGRGLQEAKRVLGDGLLTSEGALHRRQRRLIQPIFHHERIASYGDAMVRHSDRAADAWLPGREVDVHREMARLTLAIVADSLFDTDVRAAEAAEVGEALAVAVGAFTRLFTPFPNVLERLPLPSTLRFRRARDLLDRTIMRMIDERRSAGATGNDLLSLLLSARDDDGRGMGDRQVRDEAMTLFLAGHETTAVALTWTWYLLGGYPQAEATLHKEIDRVLGDRLPTVADLPNLPYTERVLRESMRLYPPAWVIGRTAIEDVEIGGTPIPAGATALVSPWLMHRDPRFWPDPLAFRPERWEQEQDRPRYAYFPFGAGPRVCIGEPFAWMEGALVLATIARRWRFRRVPGHPVALRPLITLRPRYGMRMTPEPRRP